MAEKQQQPTYQGNGYARSSDTEAAAAASHDARELRKKKRTKCFLYVVLFVIFQTAVITLFALTVMKVKTPKFRVRSASFSSNVDTGAGSLQATMNPQFSVKNTNFGRYKYGATNVEFFHGDAKIGEVTVPNSKAGWRSTKRYTAPGVNLRINNSPQLAAELSAGTVTIRSRARMTGKVELMFIMKKNRATNMNCTMDIVVASSTLNNIRCN